MGASTSKWGWIADLAQGDEGVVPIIGSELYVGKDNRPLEPLLAAELATQLNLTAQVRGTQRVEFTSTRDVALQWIAENRPLPALFAPLRNVYKPVVEDPPRPLRELAQITDFRFYVTTAIDGALERALELAGRSPVPISFVPGKGGIDPERDHALAAGIARLQVTPPASSPTVVHLLGDLRTTSFALTEGNVLDRIKSLLLGSDWLNALILALTNRNLLFLGCGFPSWLSRFFIDALVQRIDTSQGVKTRVIADEVVLQDHWLERFLSHHHKLHLYEDGGALALISEVLSVWRPAAPPTDDGQGGLPPMESGSVFISYAREDRVDVENIANKLRAGGVKVWFDLQDLEPGARWTPAIRRNIRKADLFLAVLSQNTKAAAGDNRTFHKERRWAEEHALGFREAHGFMVPVVLDQDGWDDLAPDEFLAGCQRIDLLDRVPSDQLVEKVHAALKAKRRADRSKAPGGGGRQ